MRLELTRRGDYAVRTMLALAGTGEALLSARRIAEAQQIPSRFLPHVLRDLARAGLVEGTIGRRGGYRLARPARQISLLQVINAVEGETDHWACVLRGGPCGEDGTCAVHEVFAGSRDALLKRLGGTSLGDVIAARKATSRD